MSLALNPRLTVLGAAVLFSTGGAVIKGTALTSFQVAGARSAVAAVALWLLLPAARRGYRRDLLPAAIAYAGTLICFVAATKLTTAAAAIFLQSTAPVWVLLLAPWLLGEPIRGRDVPYVVAAGVGLALVFQGSRVAEVTAPEPVLGNLVALAAGLFFALLMISLRRLARDGGGGDRAVQATVLGNALAAAICLPIALPLPAVSLQDAGALLYLGVVQIALAYWLFNRGLRSLRAIEVSLLVLLEPVLNPIWTWLAHGERPRVLALAGGAVMLAALAVRSTLERSLDSPTPARPSEEPGQ